MAASASSSLATFAANQSLVAASLGSDTNAIWNAALELAKAEEYIAAKNYLLLYLFHTPTSKEIDDACQNAVSDSRLIASRQSKDAKTWANFSSDWCGRLRLSHLLLFAVQPAEHLKVWVRMLLVADGFFGGGESHLIFAFVQLVKAKCFDAQRFEPSANVFALNEKINRWQPAVILPPEEASGPQLQPKAAPPPAAAPVMVRGRGAASQASGTSPAPKTSGLMAPTAASAVTAAANSAMNTAKSITEPLMRVRLKAYANQPQRTVWLKDGEVVRDVQAGTPKMYLPGVLLLEAAAHGREPIVNALLEAGVSIYEVDDEASSALLNATFYASTQGHRDVCRRLVEKTADPTLFNMNKLSPLDGALMRSDTELRRVFQQSESDKDFTIEARKQTNLHSAIDANDEEMAMLELGGVGNIDSCKVLGVTPLMLAARSGSRKITQLLIDRGAKPECKSKHGCTPFSIAAEEGNLEVMRALLACGVPPAVLLAPDAFGGTPLMRASENGHKAAAELTIAAAGEKVRIINEMSKGWTALMLAAYNGFSECVELLLDNGAHPEVEKRAKKSDPGYTALCYACISGHAPCVRALVSRADECPLSAQAGDAALKLAKGGGHTECVRILLDAGCEDPDAALADEALEANGVSKVTDKANAKATAKMKLLSKRKDESRPKMSKEKMEEVLHGSNGNANASVTGADGLAKAQDRGHSNAGAAPVSMSFDIEDLEKLEAEYAEQVKKLGVMKAELEKMKAMHTKMEKAAALQSKPPWAYSPSGKWAPGLWMGWHEREPIKYQKGEPAKSMSWINNWVYQAKQLSA